MRKYISILCLLMLSITLNAQTSSEIPAALGLPGDNLNLSLVLNLFKQANSVEDFEKQLNDPETKINNLDLDNDGNIDFLRVVDYGKGDYHTIVIQDPVNNAETQDVAIISVQKKNDNVAHIQIIGDEDLYGKNYIIEPLIENNSTPAPAPSTTVINNNYYSDPSPEAYVNVWGWPAVSFIFGAYYSPWISPWYWGYYPHWWRPWPHVYYSAYYTRCAGYGWRGYYRTGHIINHVHYNNYYQVNRHVSNTVQVNINKNIYRSNTYDNTNKFENHGNNYNKPYKGGQNNPKATNPGPGENKSNWGGMNKNNPDKDVYKRPGGQKPVTPPAGTQKNNWGGNKNTPAPNPYRGGNKPTNTRPNNWQPKPQSPNKPSNPGGHYKPSGTGGKRK